MTPTRRNRFEALKPLPNGPQRHQLYRISVVARGVMFAGIVWEVQGAESRVTECIICWFAMFSYHDAFVDLLEVAE